MTRHRGCGIIKDNQSHVSLVINSIYDTRYSRSKECGIAYKCKALGIGLNSADSLCDAETRTHAKTGINHIKRHGVAQSVAADVACKYRLLALHRLLDGIEGSSVRTSCAQYRRTHRKLRSIHLLTGRELPSHKVTYVFLYKIRHVLT